MNAISGSAVAEAVAWWVALVTVYLASLTTVTVPEVVAAGVTGLICAVLAVAARRAMGCSWRLPNRLLRVAVLVPLAIVADTVRLLAMLARPRKLRRATGRFSELQLPRERVALSAGRQAAGGLLVCAAPSSVLVDIDSGGSRLVIHRLLDGRPDVVEQVRIR